MMVGRKRRTSEHAVRAVRDWMPLKQLCSRLGISVSMARSLRRGYEFIAAP